ncbi:MAG: VCBS repeat-containing protein [Bacteroidota bacterium]
MKFLFAYTLICLHLALQISPAQVPSFFEEEVLDDSLLIGYGLTIGDVDGDGKPDILLADKKAFVWYRNGDWKRFVMVENLTERDNVCIAAQDINGDGRVEVAVGAQWNPGETTDPSLSGSVHFLQRPEDPTQKWSATPLPHVPTIHRMQWVRRGKASYQLIVLPLHGIGNKGGKGKGVQVLAYSPPGKESENWTYEVIDSTMHLTHNFDFQEIGEQSVLYIGGKEGIQGLVNNEGYWIKDVNRFGQDHGFGEVRLGKGPQRRKFLAGIEPIHGNTLSVTWMMDRYPIRQVLCTDLDQGHALACGDVMGLGSDQIVVGWRNPNSAGEVGIRMYQLSASGDWKMHSIDKDGMACEDLKLADLNGDGKLDIVACGRATKNLKIYWNRI